MTHSSSQATSHRPVLVVLMLLCFMTGLGVSKATIENIVLGETQETSVPLSIDEATYYEFVAPRLDRLVAEVDRVAEKVNGKSRDIVGLAMSADRIETITHDIMEFGEKNRVPVRFEKVHQYVLQGTGTISSAFGEARLALSNLDFSAMASLVHEFNDAAHLLHVAQDEMTAIVGNDTAWVAQER